MRLLYSLLTMLAYPLIYGWILRRARMGKEDSNRLRERFGYVSLTRPKGKIVWVHAASVGESMSVLPLVHKLHAADASIHIVITTGTVSSAKLLASRLPKRAYHQFVPIDVPHIARRFLRKLKPDLAIWVESEFWPNLLHETRRRSIPMVLVNARMSETSYQRWRMLSGSFAKMLRCFDAIYAGSPRDKQFLHQLGVPRVQWAGNLKYDTDPLKADPELTSQMLSKIGDRRVWLAASTHAGEEEHIIAAHRQIRDVFPEILTVIVPRHPQRADEIAALLSRSKLTFARRSKSQVVLPETDVYLADTLGELGIFYRFAGVVFVGGSLVPHGGHNPIEPAQLDCAILCGAHMHNFGNIVDDLTQVKALHILQSPEELSAQVLHLLRDHEAQEKMAKRAHEAVDSRRGASDVMLPFLLTMLGLNKPQEPAEMMSDDKAEIITEGGGK